MAFSPDDPVAIHSLGLQLRSTRRRLHRRPWRSDWKATWVPVLLLTILALVYVMMPQQAAQKETDQHQFPVVGVLGP
jgi:hypothetical protein